MGWSDILMVIYEGYSMSDPETGAAEHESTMTPSVSPDMAAAGAAVQAESAARAATAAEQMARPLAEGAITGVPGAEAPAGTVAVAEKPADWDEATGMSISDPRFPTAKYAQSGPLPAQTGGDGYNMNSTGGQARSEAPNPVAAAATETAYRETNGMTTNAAPVPPKKRSIMDRLLGRNK